MRAPFAPDDSIAKCCPGYGRLTLAYATLFERRDNIWSIHPFGWINGFLVSRKTWDSTSKEYSALRYRLHDACPQLVVSHADLLIVPVEKSNAN